MTRHKNYQLGDHLVICDICGTQQLSSNCDKTWDGYLACHTYNCWYPKHENDCVPPVIADPMPLYDPRPDRAADQVLMVAATYLSTWDFQVFYLNDHGRIRWEQAHVKWGQVDDPHDPVRS